MNKEAAEAAGYETLNIGPAITALEVPAEIYDRIVAMLRKHGGVDCEAFPFMNAEPRLEFQGCKVIRWEG